jgi:hypothetical protein
MSIRYLSNLVVMIAAAFLVVATQAFVAGTVAWLTFGIAVGLTILSAYMLVSRHGIAQRVVGGLGAVLGAWTIVASLVFAPATVVWLGFGSAIAFVVLGIAGLTAHELTTERVVHSLAVEREPRRQPVAG